METGSGPSLWTLEALEKGDWFRCPTRRRRTWWGRWALAECASRATCFGGALRGFRQKPAWGDVAEWRGSVLVLLTWEAYSRDVSVGRFGREA